MNIGIEQYFEIEPRFREERIRFESKGGREYVVYEDEERRLLAEVLPETVKICQEQGENLRDWYNKLDDEKLRTDGRDTRYDIQMILRNLGTIMAFYKYMLDHSPCGLNIFRGVQEIVEEFPNVSNKRYLTYFIPEEIATERRDPSEGLSVITTDGTPACVYSVESETHKYKNISSYLDDLQSNKARSQGPSYFVRSPYQMMMTILKHICENRLIFRRCPCCGKVFQANHAGRKYCSKKCSHIKIIEQTELSKAKDRVKALRNFKQAVHSRFIRYCQGKTKTFSISSLEIPEGNDELIQEFDRAVTQRDQVLFYNALDNLIQHQKERLQPEQYVQWLETAGRKRKSYGNCRDSEK